VVMLGLGGGLVGGLALLVDRAADPGPTPPLVATERATPVVAEPSPPPTAPPTPPPVPPAPPAATSAPPPAAAPSAKQPVAALSKAGSGPTAGHKPPPREAPPMRAATPPRETPARVLEAAEFEFQEGRLLGAVTLARRGLALGGGTKALMLLGKIYRTTGEYDRAVEAYDQILRKSPGDVAAQEGRRKALASMFEASAGPPRAGK
jgi:Tetratricopeptide repeat